MSNKNTKCWILLTFGACLFVKLSCAALIVSSLNHGNSTAIRWQNVPGPIHRSAHTTGSIGRTKRQTPERISLFNGEVSRNSRRVQFAPVIGRSYGWPTSYYQRVAIQPWALNRYGRLETGRPGCLGLPVFFKFQPRRAYHSNAWLPLPENASPAYPAAYPRIYQYPLASVLDPHTEVAANTWRSSDDLWQSSKAQELVCGANERRCGDGSKCIDESKWCDNAVDCADASDETMCTCRERIAKTRVCDNYLDCPRGEDELGCFGCPKTALSCGEHNGESNAGCVELTERCDGLAQCPNGKDERDCDLLSSAAHNDGNEIFPVGYSRGFLWRNLKGKWYPVCGYAHAWAQDACASELGASTSGEPWLELQSNDAITGPYLTESSGLIPKCKGGLTYVRCPKVAVGTRFANETEEEEADPILGSAGPSSNGTDSEDPFVSVVGGRPSLPRAWPFVVIINRDGKFHCGGAILNELWILTAAHCLTSYSDFYYEIEAGTLRRSSYASSLQIRRLKGLLIHPDYNSRILKNDIALLHLDKPLSFNSWVRPVLLPGTDRDDSSWKRRPSPGTSCVAIGWGATREGGPDPDHLREVKVPIIECVHSEDKNAAEICAGYKEGGRDACQGDSGGPLMCRVSPGSSEWYVGGIVSHGIGCARRNEPGAYTKVSYFVDWINSAMQRRWSPDALKRTVTTCPGFSCARPYVRCLPDRRRCDGTADCLKAEDEADCSALKTFANQWLG